MRDDGSVTEGKTEQVAELLQTCFPPLPMQVEDERKRPQRTLVEMPRLLVDKVERRIFAASLWKAPGDDGLPAGVEADMACSEGTGAATLSGITRKGTPNSMEKRHGHSYESRVKQTTSLPRRTGDLVTGHSR
jgi:hypothetical protein